jgi:hypothetical protein
MDTGPARLAGMVLTMIMLILSGLNPKLPDFMNTGFPNYIMPQINYMRFLAEALYIIGMSHFIIPTTPLTQYLTRN